MSGVCLRKRITDDLSMHVYMDDWGSLRIWRESEDEWSVICVRIDDLSYIYMIPGEFDKDMKNDWRMPGIWIYGWRDWLMNLVAENLWGSICRWIYGCLKNDWGMSDMWWILRLIDESCSGESLRMYVYVYVCIHEWLYVWWMID